MLKLARKGVVEVNAAGFVLTAEGMAIARGLK
jgi:Mn-dependent DtxR family transcriptional regulator